MACTGYEHGSRVVLSVELPGIDVPIGSNGKVIGINRQLHEIDVAFTRYGEFKGLAVHSFQLLRSRGI